MIHNRRTEETSVLGAHTCRHRHQQGLEATSHVPVQPMTSQWRPRNSYTLTDVYVQCTAYMARRTVYAVHCTGDDDKVMRMYYIEVEIIWLRPRNSYSLLYAVHCTTYSVRRTLYIVQYTVYNV